MNENPIKKFGITLDNAAEALNEKHIFEYAYEYYLDNGEMPYGTAKARTSDPDRWILDRLYEELGPL